MRDNQPVIYQIRSTINGKIYIGGTNDYKNRKCMHLTKMKKNKHHNIFLQNHFNESGIACFEFTIIEIVSDRQYLLEREQYYLDTLNPEFNICKIAGSSKGVKRSEETKNIKRQAWIGHKMNNGRTLSKEHKQKISIKNKGKKRTEEQRQNMRIASTTRGKGKAMSHLKFIKDNIVNKTQKQIAIELMVHPSTISKILTQCI